MKSTTMEETAHHVMGAFAKDADAQLSKHEFAAFIDNNFAGAANITLVDMPAFMTAMSALKENTEAEQEYLEAIGGEDY